MESASPQPIAAPRRWPLFLAGIALFVIGPALSAFEILVLARLQTAWYVPILATLGVLLMAISTWQRKGVLRVLALGLFVLVCAGEWLMVGVVTKTPPYEGPARVNQPLPAFTTRLADGSTFADKDLLGDHPTLLLFYRGHW
jgi:hypothetical protein